jgi:O-antigen ligase
MNDNNARTQPKESTLLASRGFRQLAERSGERLQTATRQLFVSAGGLTLQTVMLPKAFVPVIQLLSRDAEVTQQCLLFVYAVAGLWSRWVVLPLVDLLLALAPWVRRLFSRVCGPTAVSA